MDARIHGCGYKWMRELMDVEWMRELMGVDVNAREISGFGCEWILKLMDINGHKN